MKSIGVKTNGKKAGRIREKSSRGRHTQTVSVSVKDGGRPRFGWRKRKSEKRKADDSIIRNLTDFRGTGLLSN